MNKLTAACLSLCLLAGIQGCKSVVSDHLIGQPLDAEQAAEYEGVWGTGDSILYLKHVEGGTLVMAGVEWEEDAFNLESHTIVVTSHRDTRFVLGAGKEDESEAHANNQAAESVEPDSKPWSLMGILVSSSDGSLVLYATRFDGFKQAMDDGQLECELKDDDRTLHIQGDKAALDAFIQPDNLHKLFNYQKPGVLTRISE
jgi:hypothetical protein